jgi:hypothetical protein
MAYGQSGSYNGLLNNMTSTTNFTPLAQAIQSGLTANLQGNAQGNQLAQGGLVNQQNTLNRSLSQALNYQNPTYQTGQNALQQAANIAGAGASGNYNQALSSPAFQAILQQGINAAQQSGAARGNLYSGGQQLALQNVGQALASKYLNDIFNQNLALSQQGQQAGNQASSLISNNATQVGSSQANAGNVAANAAIAAGQLQNQAGLGIGETQVAQSTIRGLRSGQSFGMGQSSSIPSSVQQQDTSLPQPAAQAPLQGYSAGPTGSTSSSTSGGSTGTYSTGGGGGSSSQSTGLPGAIGGALSGAGGAGVGGAGGANTGGLGSLLAGSGGKTSGGGSTSGSSGLSGGVNAYLNSGGNSGYANDGTTLGTPTTGGSAGSALGSSSGSTFDPTTIGTPMSGGVGGALGGSIGSGAPSTQFTQTMQSIPANLKGPVLAGINSGGARLVTLGGRDFVLITSRAVGDQIAGGQTGYVPVDQLQSASSGVSVGGKI